MSTGGDPASQKTAVPGDNGSKSDSKRDSESPSAENKKRTGVLRAGAPEFIPRSRAPPATPSPRAPEFIPQSRAPPVTPPPPRAPEVIPLPRAPAVAPPYPRAPEFNPRETPPRPMVDETCAFRTPSPPAPSPPAPRSTGSRSSHSSSGPQPRPPPQQPPMQGFAAAAKLGRAAKLEMESRKEQLLQYLNSEDCDYISQAKNLGRKLTIDFEDLLQKNRALAIEICKDRGNNTTWLDEACQEFFKSMQLPSDEVAFTFVNIPARLLEAKDYMQSKDCTEGRDVCSRTAHVEIASEHGREVTDLIMNRILDDVADKGVSWNGKLGLEDILFGETLDGKVKVYIAKSPVYRSFAPIEARLEDLKSIWTMIEVGCNLSRSNLPLYFSELSTALTTAKELPGWFITFLRFHPALYGPTPRGYFLTSLQMVTRRKKLLDDAVFGSLFSIEPLPDNEDWRSIATDGPLKRLLDFNFPGSKKAQQKQKKGSCNDPNKNQCPYDNTTSSLLDYMKNGLSHLAQYITVIDEEEVELFLALNFPMLLPDVMKGILMRGGMQDKFSACWRAYCNSK